MNSRFIELLEIRKKQLIEEAPKLFLSIRKAPYYLGELFDLDGNPKGDFLVTNRTKQRVAEALMEPHHKSSNGQLYYGNLTDGNIYSPGPNEYLIKATPTFLSDAELKYLVENQRITKKIRNIKVELIPPLIQMDNYQSLVMEYKRDIVNYRNIINEINKIEEAYLNINKYLPIEQYKSR